MNNKNAKVKISRSQWEKIGRTAGWTDEMEDSLTEERMVTFFDQETGDVLAKEKFSVEGFSESDRFQKLESDALQYVEENFSNPEEVDWEDELVNVTG